MSSTDQCYAAVRLVYALRGRVVAGAPSPTVLKLHNPASDTSNFDTSARMGAIVVRLRRDGSVCGKFLCAWYSVTMFATDVARCATRDAWRWLLKLRLRRRSGTLRRMRCAMGGTDRGWTAPRSSGHVTCLLQPAAHGICDMVASSHAAV